MKKAELNHDRVKDQSIKTIGTRLVQQDLNSNECLTNLLDILGLAELVELVNISTALKQIS